MGRVARSTFRVRLSASDCRGCARGCDDVSIPHACDRCASSTQDGSRGDQHRCRCHRVRSDHQSPAAAAHRPRFEQASPRRKAPASPRRRGGAFDEQHQRDRAPKHALHPASCAHRTTPTRHRCRRCCRRRSPQTPRIATLPSALLRTRRGLPLTRPGRGLSAGPGSVNRCALGQWTTFGIESAAAARVCASYRTLPLNENDIELGMTPEARSTRSSDPRKVVAWSSKT